MDGGFFLSNRALFLVVSMRLLNFCPHRRRREREQSPSPPPPPNEPVTDLQAVNALLTLKQNNNNSPTAKTPRPGLRRGTRYSAEALRNGVVRMKSERHLTSSRDIEWMNEGIQRKRTATIPPPSWSRFPSHTRAERSGSSAGKEDNVHPRDFALEVQMRDPSGSGGGREEDWKTRYRRHTFERSMIHKLRKHQRVYHWSVNRGGVRSSISEGGELEYPELAILPTLEAIPLASRAASPYPVEPSEPSSVLGGPQEAGLYRAVDGARLWSQMYEGCLPPRQPGTTDETSTRDNMSAFLRPEDASRHSRQSSERRISPRSSTEIRHSTLDFQKCLEEYEMRARERALQFANDSSGRPKSMG